MPKESPFFFRVLAFFKNLPYKASSVILPVVKSRRTYPVSLTVNDRLINEVVIDPHYEGKHSESISDEIILALVAKLDGKTFDADDQDNEYEYFKTEPIEYERKNYRLIWLLKDDCMFIGVINAYRRP
jgi:hypothetical protein